MIDWILDPEKEVTIEMSELHEQLVQDINYLVEEGFIQVEEGDDGQIRLYPA